MPAQEYRAAQEKAHNEAVLQRLVQGERAHSSAALYGGTFQLQHGQSGLYICAHEAAALVDEGCRKVSLANGGPGCQWKIKPKFLIRTEGSTIYGGDDWVIESVALPGYFLHMSQMPYDTLRPGSVKAANASGLGDLVR